MANTPTPSSATVSPDATPDAASPKHPQSSGSDSPKALISVIIPVYNVAPYLRRCVESVLCQTHRRLQVILVDDGSTDGSGILCDDIATQDERVEVIHQPNSGVSAARNAGMSVARGEYIGFVDSDDYLMPDMYSYLLSGINKYHSQISVCDFFVRQGSWNPSVGPVAGSEAPAGYWPAHGNGLMVLNSSDAIALLIADSILQNYLWDKLYQASLWDDISFPDGRVFEDVSTIYKVICRAERIAMLPEAKYVYEPLASGIVRKRSIRNEIDGVTAYEQRARDLAPSFPSLKTELVDGVIKSMITVWQLSWDNRNCITPDMKERIRLFSQFVRNNPPSKQLHDSFGLAGQATLALLKHPGAWSRALSSAIYHAYLRRHPEWAEGASAGAGQE